MDYKVDYKVGDTIEYVDFLGGTRIVLVEEKDPDIKNGRPGFDGVMADGMAVWGYDYQISRIVKIAQSAGTE